MLRDSYCGVEDLQCLVRNEMPYIIVELGLSWLKMNPLDTRSSVQIQAAYILEAVTELPYYYYCDVAKDYLRNSTCFEHPGQYGNLSQFGYNTISLSKTATRKLLLEKVGAHVTLHLPSKSEGPQGIVQFAYTPSASDSPYFIYRIPGKENASIQSGTEIKRDKEYNIVHWVLIFSYDDNPRYGMKGFFSFVTKQVYPHGQHSISSAIKQAHKIWLGYLYV